MSTARDAGREQNVRQFALVAPEVPGELIASRTMINQAVDGCAGSRGTTRRASRTIRFAGTPGNPTD